MPARFAFSHPSSSSSREDWRSRSAPPRRGPIAASILLAGLAGALGGTMAGILKLRDNVSRIGDLRSLRPALYVQPLLGAAAGLILLLAVVGGFLTESPEQGWAKYGLLAFAAGFSEPFFLGIVNRVASTGSAPSSPPSL